MNIPFPGTLVLVVSLIQTGLVLSQERMNIPFQRISVDQGLSQSEVLAILQDEQGFMWFGTREGLDRYNGYQMENVQYGHDEHSQLPGHTVVAMAKEHGGQIWLAMENHGLVRGQFAAWQRFSHRDQVAGSLPEDRVTSLYIDGVDRLWVGTRSSGMALFDPDTDLFQGFKHESDNPKSLSNDQVRVITGDSGGVIWLGTTNSIERFDPIVRSFERYCIPTAAGECDWVTSLDADGAGGLWVGTRSSGLWRMDRASRESIQVLSGDHFGRYGVAAVISDSENSVWSGGGLGLIKWDPDTAELWHFQYRQGDPNSLSSNDVRSLYQDEGGVLWVGTSNGLCKWNALIGAFAHYRPDPEDPNELNKNQITSFAEDGQGNLWVGTFGGGLNRLNRETDSFSHFTKNPGDPESLSNNRVMALFNDSRDVLWVGTMGGLNRFNRDRGKFTAFSNDRQNPASLGGNAISSIAEDRRGRLWIGLGRDGLSVYDTESQVFNNYRHDSLKPTSLASDQVMVVYRDRGGVMWIGTQDAGLDRYNLTTDSFEHIAREDGNPNSLSSNGIWTICEDRRGNLWIGTEGGGLEYWDQNDRIAGRASFRNYNTHDGLLSADIYGIVEDKRGLLWLSNNKGVASFDPESQQFRHYDTTRGLQDMEFNVGAAFIAHDGRIFLGGVNGFNAFFPEWIRDNNHVPPVVITQVLKLDRQLTDFSSSAGFSLSHNDTMISFEFAALDYTASAGNRYQYKLDGFDKDWVKNGTLRRATYTNLGAGDYTFRVKGSNNDGLWNEEGASLSFHVYPPVWRSKWAILVYMLMFGLMIVRFRRSQVRKLEVKARYSRRLEEEVQKRIKEIEAQNLELEQLNSKLMETGLTDPLTGLRNRRFLQHHFYEDLALDQGGRLAGDHTEIVFLVLDLDHFKEINENYGHNAGDLILIQMRQLLEGLHYAEMVFRLGGDEFLVTSKCSRLEDGARMARDLHQKVGQYLFDLGNSTKAHIKCTLGFCLFPFSPARAGALNWEQALALAERALLSAKKTQRDSWLGLGPGLGPTVINLQDAINQDIEALIRTGGILVNSSFSSQRSIVWK